MGKALGWQVLMVNLTQSKLSWEMGLGYGVDYLKITELGRLAHCDTTIPWTVDLRL